MKKIINKIYKHKIHIAVYLLCIYILGSYYSSNRLAPLWQHYFPIKVLAFALTNIFMSIYNGIYTYGLVDNVSKSYWCSIAFILASMLLVWLIYITTGYYIWYIFYWQYVVWCIIRFFENMINIFLYLLCIYFHCWFYTNSNFTVWH